MEKGAREVGQRSGVELAECYRFFDLVPNPSQRAYRREIQEEAVIRQAEVLPDPPEPATDWG